ncbi:MAG: hypothetical protein ACYCWE_10720 [Eubacteriales bacterium]
MKKNVCLLLVLFMLFCGFACSESEKDHSKDTAAATAAEAAETEMTRANTPDNLPQLDFNGMVINIYYFGQEFAHYYDAVGESSGDIVYDAVYMRNIAVNERLNTEINWIRGGDDWDSHPAAVQKAMLAGVSDYDIIFEENSRAFQHSLEGYFINLLDAEYLDYGQPWWYDELMYEGSIDTSKRYFVTGDFALTTLFGASAVYFNKNIYTDVLGDVNDIYQTVLDGKWTADVMMDLCRRIYSDINGSGTSDEDDLLGFRFTQWGVPNYLSMSTGLTYTARDDAGYPVLDLNTKDAVLWADKLYNMLYRDNMSIECKMTDMAAAFRNNLSLFYVGMFSTANTLRDCEFEYGIIPHPKLKESLDYLCAAGTVNGEGAAVPVSAPEDKFEASCALLEALCAESYRSVVPSWYDTALKVKYIDAEIDADMIDLIYNHVGTSFIMMADKTLGIGSIFTYTVYGSKSEGTFSSYYAKNENGFNTKWSNMIEKYKAVEN